MVGSRRHRERPKAAWRSIFFWIASLTLAMTEFSPYARAEFTEKPESYYGRLMKSCEYTKPGAITCSTCRTSASISAAPKACAGCRRWARRNRGTARARQAPSPMPSNARPAKGGVRKKNRGNKFRKVRQVPLRVPWASL